MCALRFNSIFGQLTINLQTPKLFIDFKNFFQKWSCPMCRDICNCSFCRKKAGKAPLGQISEMARRKGYRSVHHFLMEHEGPDYIEEEEEEAPKRILRKEIKKEVLDEDSEEVDRKPQRSGLVFQDLIM